MKPGAFPWMWVVPCWVSDRPLVEPFIASSDATIRSREDAILSSVFDSWSCDTASARWASVNELAADTKLWRLYCCISGV